MALYRRAQRTRLLVVSLVMVSLLTITIDYRGGQSGPFAAAGRGALTLIGPLQEAVSAVVHPIVAFFTGLAHIGSLQDENEALRQQIKQDEQGRLREEVLERENRQLKEALAIENRLGLTTVGANVIAQSVGNFDWSVNVDRGSSDGLKVDMPVVTGDGLVGRVVEVAPNWSTVQLIIDPHSSVAARLVTSGETGLVTGQREKDLKMDLVDPESDVPATETVVTSGYQGGLYPPNIPIGIVSHVYTDPTSLSKVISVRPAVNFSSLEFVLIVTRK